MKINKCPYYNEDCPKCNKLINKTMQEKITITKEQIEFLKQLTVFADKMIEGETGFKLSALEPEQPTFSVGMRVECTEEADGFTFGMVYRIFQIDSVGYYILNDKGISSYYHNSSSKYFTPYEKPKEGEGYWTINIDNCCADLLYFDDISDNYWNLGLAFAGKNAKEQAEFARERLSKLF